MIIEKTDNDTVFPSPLGTTIGIEGPPRFGCTPHLVGKAKASSSSHIVQYAQEEAAFPISLH